ncbi:MAG: ribonuclease H-like domain-containing protein [Pyrinomonadaceae bacterium]
MSRHLGFEWSDAAASGLQSLRWRAQWEFSKDDALKQKLITYNAEDCQALERVATAIIRLCDQSELDNTSGRPNDSVVSVDSMQRQYPQRFGTVDFALPELAAINKAAYWDYQRNKVYVRINPRLKRVSKRKACSQVRRGHPNKTVDLPAPARCRGCNATEFYKHGWYAKTVYDLRFGRSSIRRWIVKYRSHRYRCFSMQSNLLV